jgi:hypothetical protein
LSALLSSQKIKLSQAESILLLDLLPFLGELKVPPLTYTASPELLKGAA